ncbi:MAG: hemerythrin domain-containing protein [Gallionellaceae bacterium]|nr:hemerythrin domain-containing protein [Gallionellaceae bacterium]
MNNLIGSAPAPSFDAPLEMLLACHGRIQAQCATLKKIMLHLPRQGCDTQAQQAATNIVRYFDTAGVYHHQDEEKDLFPLLLATNTTEANILIYRLLDEHQVMEAAWQTLRPFLNEVIEGKVIAFNNLAADHFIAVYDRHIAVENAQLLPLAKQLLTAEQLAQLGHNMAARRMN